MFLRIIKFQSVLAINPLTKETATILRRCQLKRFDFKRFPAIGKILPAPATHQIFEFSGYRVFTIKLNYFLIPVLRREGLGFAAFLISYHELELSFYM